jgi:hypothetical protein
VIDPGRKSVTSPSPATEDDRKIGLGKDFVSPMSSPAPSSKVDGKGRSRSVSNGNSAEANVATAVSGNVGPSEGPKYPVKVAPLKSGGKVSPLKSGGMISKGHSE